MEIPRTMTATVLVAPHKFELQQRPVPVPGDEDVLVRVRACGVCGTDLKIIHTGMPLMPPYGEFIFGHEYAGDVVAIGRTVASSRSAIGWSSRPTWAAAAARIASGASTRRA